jgi:hypothetical protein
LLLDDPDDDDDEYLMAYEAVCEYCNKQHSTFNRYQLPSELVLEGDEKMKLRRVLDIFVNSSTAIMPLAASYFGVIF